MIRDAWTRIGALCCPLAMTVALTNCATDAPLDPIGNWNLMLSFGAGNCGFMGSFSSTITVTHGPNGYLISESDPNITVTGTITCTADKCTMSEAESGSGTYDDGTPYTASVSSNLTLDASARVTGSGQYGEHGDDGSSCSQTFTVTGTKS